MRVVVLQSNYLPWKGYFDLICSADLFLFYDEVKYTKNDWRNRNRICSPNGPFWLTIPVSRDAVKQNISEVLLPEGRWTQDHWKSLLLNYSKTPFWGEVSPLLEEALTPGRFQRLSELNQFLVVEISKLLSLKTEFRRSSDFTLKEGRVERLLDLLTQVGATEYISGPSARGYLEDHLDEFTARGITVRFKNYSGYPEYTQPGAQFEHAVSMVDLISRIGSAAATSYFRSDPEFL